MKVLATFAFLLVSTATMAQERGVEAFRCGTAQAERRVDILSLYDAYQQRSVNIIEGGLRTDTALLQRAIAPDAKFEVMQGDVLVGHPNGPAGASEFARFINPKSFQYTTAGPGPISMNPCGDITVEVLFEPVGVQAAKVAFPYATLVTFKYRNGLLVEATGSSTSVVRADLSR